MELDILIRQRPIDIDGIEGRLLEIDPAALVDFDPATGRLRLSTCARQEEVTAALAAAGHPVADADLTLLPSVCCGGCGG